MDENVEAHISGPLAGLHAEATRFVAAVSGRSALTARHEGSDSKGVVTVATLGDGRIGTVTVAEGWRAKVPSTALGGAVLEAIDDATHKRMEAWARSIDMSAAREGGNGPDSPAGRSEPGTQRPAAGSTPPPAAPSFLPVSGPIGNPAAPQALAAVGELSELLASARSALTDLSARLEERQTAETAGHSQTRTTRVTLRGNQPVAIDFDEAWLSRANAKSIGASVREALADAYARRGQLGIDDLVAGTPLAALRDLAGDPAALARRVGLLGDPPR